MKIAENVILARFLFLPFFSAQNTNKEMKAEGCNESQGENISAISFLLDNRTAGDWTFWTSNKTQIIYFITKKIFRCP